MPDSTIPMISTTMPDVATTSFHKPRKSGEKTLSALVYNICQYKLW